MEVEHEVHKGGGDWHELCLTGKGGEEEKEGGSGGGNLQELMIPPQECQLVFGNELLPIYIILYVAYGLLVGSGFPQT